MPLVNATSSVIRLRSWCLTVPINLCTLCPCCGDCALNIRRAIYYVMSRGDQQDDIFLDHVDRHDFIKTLAEARQKTGWHQLDI